MHRSSRDKDYVLNLEPKELIDYYNCYSHHHFNRHYCHDNSDFNRTCSRECPCCPDALDSDHLNHFCTGYSSDLSSLRCDSNHVHNMTCSKCDFKNENSIIVCEHFRPSFTSKQDQIDFIKRDISQIRMSKNILKNAIKDIDLVLGETKEKNDGLNDVERFYRSDKFIGSSMKITSYKKKLPRNDIRPGKFIVETKTRTDNCPDYGSALFSLRDKNIFTDNDILAFDKIKQKKPDPRMRSKSAVISIRPRNQR